MQIAPLLNIGRGVTALIGGGGKTTMLYTLTEELRKKGTVLLCTSTHIMRPTQYEVLERASEAEVSAALSAHGAVCVGEPSAEGKLGPPSLSFDALARLADYVLVEADGSRRLPLKAHAHQLNDLFTAIRIAKEFGVKLTLEHCTEGQLAAERFAAEGYPMAVGPSLTHASKFELRNKTFATPGILARAGAHVSIITDSPVIPQHYLPLCAGLAVKSGMDPYDALRAITLCPAEHIGVADRVGSIEAGKDADIVLCRGDVMDISGDVVRVLIEGRDVDMSGKGEE